MCDRGKSFFFVVLCALALCSPSLLFAGTDEEVSVAVGGQFKLELRYCVACGYDWAIAGSLPSWLELVSHEQTPDPRPPGYVGGSGTETWTFRASAPGSATLTFEYKRYSGGTPSDVHVCQVTAGPQGLGIVFVKIPGGTFQMGDHDGSGYADERPVHTVTLDAFEIGKYEITNAQYAAYLNAAAAAGLLQMADGVVYASSDYAKSQPYFNVWGTENYCEIDYSHGKFSVATRDGKSMADHPVVQVGWYGATAFCDYYGYRLPTEAEWEYAARGGYQNPYYGFPWGSNTIDCSKATYASDGISCNPLGLTIPPYTSPVGYYGPQGAYGLCDMSGNAWEYCQDWYDAAYYSSSSASNPTGPASGTERVFRGGSWHDGGYSVANRYWHHPQSRNWGGGFRVCRSATNPSPADSSLVLYLPFDEGDGRTTNDLSIYHNVGTIAGAEWVPGIRGTALEFASNSYVTLRKIPAYDVTDAVSLLAWVKTTQSPIWGRVIDKSDYPYNGFDLCLTASNVGQPRFEFFVDETVSSVTGTTAVIDDEWHFIASTFGNKTLRMYVDGRKEAEAQSEGQVDIVRNNWALTIGAIASSNGAQQYYGRIDEVAMYNRELSANEVMAIFQNGMP